MVLKKMVFRSRDYFMLFLVFIILIFSFLVFEFKQGDFSGRHVSENYNYNYFVSMKNPASVACKDIGGILDIRETLTRGQVGYCVFSNGEECSEWSYFIGDCGNICGKYNLNYRTEKVIGKKGHYAPYSAKCIDKRNDRFVGFFVELSDLKNKVSSKELDKVTQSSRSSLITGNAGKGGRHTPDYLDYWDWRNVSNDDWMTPVKNQAACGSCWAFAAVGVVEAMFNIVVEDVNLDLDLSEEELVSSCWEGGNCGGGWAGSAMTYMTEEVHGITDEECFPYISDTCIYQTWGCDSNSCAFYNGDNCANSICNEPYRCPEWEDRLYSYSIDDIVPVSYHDSKEYLSNIGPFTLLFSMDGWWDKDGIFRCGGSYEDPDHIVVIVGYNDSIPGYWIAKNSWGEDWGLDGGYFKLGYYECGPKFPYTKGVTMGLQWPPLKTNNRTGNITNLTYSGGGNNIGDKIKRGFGGKIECLNTSVNASTGSGSVECDDREDCSLGPCVEKSGNPEICTCCTNEVLEEEPEGEKCDPPGGDPGVGSLQCKITMEQQNKDWKCNTKDCTCVLKVNITEPPPR